MQKNYDVIIVGAGPAGIMTSYELVLKDPSKKVLLIDKGQDVMNRHCPIKDKKIKSCPIIKDNEPGCLPACSITAGFGGAGAYSDGKFNITSEFGGWLTDYLDNREVEEVIQYVDNLYLKHGATLEITDPTTDKIKEIEKRGYAIGQVIKHHIRKDDIAGRIGGDEFALAYANINLENIKCIAERLMHDYHEEIKNTYHIDMTISIGIAQILPTDHIKDAYRKADLALYEAKRMGKNKYSIYK